MIGLDTNVLARFFGQDDPVQSPKANAILDSLTTEEPGWVATAALLELVWVMTSKFRADRTGVCRVVDVLMSRSEIVIENSDLVRRALNQYRHGSADFADCLIASHAENAGCVQTLTFDIDAAKTAGMTLIS